MKNRHILPRLLAALALAAGVLVAPLTTSPAQAANCLITDRIDVYDTVENPYVAWRVTRTCTSTGGWVDLSRGGDSACIAITAPVGTVGTYRYQPSWWALAGTAQGRYCSQSSSPPYGYTVKTTTPVRGAGGGGGGGSW